MDNCDFYIKSAYLATKEKLQNKFLSVGKFIRENNPDTFLFYLIEINSPWAEANKVKKSITEIFEKCLDAPVEDISCALLEKKLESINASLDHLAKNGDKSWIGNFNCVLGLVHNNFIHIAQTGKLSGYLFRQGKISSLVENSILADPLPQKTFADLTSGPILKDDRIVFGNTELFNFFSLDRVRKMVENFDTKESILEFIKFLKHRKAFGINALIIEADKENSKSKELLPEIFYLDEKQENILNKINKKLKPVYISLKKFLAVYGKKSLHHGKKLMSKSKEKWDQDYGPKTKEFVGKNMPKIKEALKNVKTKIGEKKEPVKEGRLSQYRIKTRLYNERESKKELFSSIFNSIGNGIKIFFTFIQRRENRKYFYLVLILIFLSIGYFKIKANNNIQEQKKQEIRNVNSYDQAQEMFNKAKEDIALGKTNDPSKLQEALTLTENAEKSDQTKDSAEKLAIEIQASIDKFNKTTRTVNPTPLFSFPVAPEKIVMVGQDIYGISSEGKIYSANINDKTPSLLASIGKDNGKVISLTHSESDQKIYFLTDISRVIAFDIKSKTNEVVTANDSKEWAKATSIAAFGSNLYLLDSQNGQVLKYTKGSTGFSQGTTYGDSKKANIKNSLNLVIDGNLYVLTSTGQLVKLSRGLIDKDLSLKDIPSPGEKIESPTKVYTDADSNFIYVLDTKLNRIIKFNKTGAFVNQYAITGPVIEDFVVGSKIQKLWTLSKGSIYQIEL